MVECLFVRLGAATAKLCDGVCVCVFTLPNRDCYVDGDFEPLP